MPKLPKPNDKEIFILTVAEIFCDFYKPYGQIGRAHYSSFRQFYQYIMAEEAKIKEKYPDFILKLQQDNTGEESK